MIDRPPALCQTLLCALLTLTDFKISLQPYKVNTITMPILQVKKLRPRESKWFPWGHTAGTWWSLGINPGNRTPVAAASCLLPHLR